MKWTEIKSPKVSDMIASVKPEKIALSHSAKNPVGDYHADLAAQSHKPAYKVLFTQGQDDLDLSWPHHEFLCLN